jgi:arsenite methyltransferase
MSTDSSRALREEVRRHYAAAARAVTRSAASGSTCGAGSCCSETAGADFGESLYRVEETAELPETAVRASLGCSNPTPDADLEQGDVVLDLGPAAASTSSLPPGVSGRPASSSGST